jgi:alkylhydroperoxidase family enzyme
LAIEYAERFALDQRNIGGDFFTRLRTEFSDREVVELTVLLARFLGFGRLTKVLGLEDICGVSFDQPALNSSEETR